MDISKNKIPEGSLCSVCKNSIKCECPVHPEYDLGYRIDKCKDYIYDRTRCWTTK